MLSGQSYWQSYLIILLWHRDWQPYLIILPDQSYCQSYLIILLGQSYCQSYLIISLFQPWDVHISLTLISADSDSMAVIHWQQDAEIVRGLGIYVVKATAGRAPSVTVLSFRLRNFVWLSFLFLVVCVYFEIRALRYIGVWVSKQSYCSSYFNKLLCMSMTTISLAYPFLKASETH